MFPVYAQTTVALMPDTQFYASDANGNPLSGGQVFTYAAGTTSPMATYTDSTGSVLNANPVILNSAGRASIWLTQNAYKIVVEDASGNVQWSQDNVAGGNFVTNIQAATTGVAYALQYCNNVTSPDESCINNAFANSGVKTVQVASGIPINGTVTVSAGEMLVLQPGTYPLGNTGKFVLNGDNSVLWCPGGPDNTIITVPQTYSGSNGAVITMSGALYASSVRVEGCQIQFSQPETTSRASLIQYVPAIVTGSRARILHDKIVEAWIGIQATGPDGGAGMLIDDLQMSAFEIGINLDNTRDTVRINNLHAWPFGFATDAGGLLIPYTDPANISINSGRCDDLDITNSLFFTGTSINLFQGTGSQPGPTFGSIVNTDFDTYGGIFMTAGSMTIASSDWSLNCSTCTAIHMSGGNLDIAGSSFGELASAGFVNLTGGTLQIGSSVFTIGAAFASGAPAISDNGGTCDLRISDSFFSFGTVNASAVNVQNGAYLSMNNNRFSKSANIAYTNPIVNFAGAVASRGVVSDSTLSDLGTGSGVFVNVAVDGWIDIHDTALLGYTVTLPGTHTEVHTHDNF